MLLQSQKEASWGHAHTIPSFYKTAPIHLYLNLNPRTTPHIDLARLTEGIAMHAPTTHHTLIQA
jgi:hypothetical protein